MPGGNFLTRMDHADHVIVAPELKGPRTRNMRFNSIDRYDRPTGKMGAAISEATQEALYLTTRERFFGPETDKRKDLSKSARNRTMRTGRTHEY